MIFVGIDWAEAHHDVCVLDPEGEVLATRRIPEGLEGAARLHALLAEHAESPEEVVVGIETDRGLLVGALAATGYEIHAINPLAASRYRVRYTTSRAKSDRGDARVLADLVRTDRQHHRPAAPDSELLGAIKVLARAQQARGHPPWLPGPSDRLRGGTGVVDEGGATRGLTRYAPGVSCAVAGNGRGGRRSW